MSVDERLGLIRELKGAGISTIVKVAPLIPFINDNEEDISAILRVLKEYGTDMVDLMDMRYALLRPTREFFFKELEKRFPDEYAYYIESVFDKEDRKKKTPRDLSEIKEIVPRDRYRLSENVYSLAEKLNITYDTRYIRGWKRQYLELEAYI